MLRAKTTPQTEKLIKRQTAETGKCLWWPLALCNHCNRINNLLLWSVSYSEVRQKHSWIPAWRVINFYCSSKHRWMVLYQ